MATPAPSATSPAVGALRAAPSPMSGAGRPRVDGDRLWARLMALGQIGATPAGGVNRQALSPDEAAAWRQMLAWGQTAGLAASTDDAGNLYLCLPGTDPGAPAVFSGSHLDSQPTGGRFDGAYGVVAALEVLTTLAEHGLRPRHDLVAVAWMNEEGSRFAPGMMGSQWFAGTLALAAMRQARDADQVSVGQALDALHAQFPTLPRRPAGGPVAAYVEAHIEQGPRLEAAGCPIGVVTGIQGKQTFELRLQGDKGHAGTLAMAERRDALAAFTRVAQALYAEVGGHDAEVKFTIGRLEVAPNAPSVVPDQVVCRIDLRHPDNATLARLGQRLAALCQAHAAPCTVQCRTLVNASGHPFDAGLQQAIRSAANALGLPSMDLLSAAGHDARHLAPLAPSAMVFIPCRGGISHAEHEWAEPAHVTAGADVLLRVLADCAGLPLSRPNTP